MSNIKIEGLCGKGGYGNVYRAIIGTPLLNNNLHLIEKTIAIKYIEYNKNKGIESLIETYIVKCLHHNHLIHALNVDITPSGRVEIMLPLAQCDAATILRKKLFKIKP